MNDAFAGKVFRYFKVLVVVPEGEPESETGRKLLELLVESCRRTGFAAEVGVQLDQDANPCTAAFTVATLRG
jgi:hypothetical protein